MVFDVLLIYELFLYRIGLLQDQLVSQTEQQISLSLNIYKKYTFHNIPLPSKSNWNNQQNKQFIGAVNDQVYKYVNINF